MEELKKEFLEYRKEFGLTKMMRIVFQRSHEDFIQRCKDFVDSAEWVDDINELFKMFEYDVVLPKCIICGKTISFHSYDVAHNHNLKKPSIKPLLTCSKECRYSDEMVKMWKDKMTKTNLERYGTAETLSLKEMHDKAKETIREKYGVDNVSKSDIIKKKKEDTFINHYGVNNIFAAEEGKNKIKQTLMERYGVENVAHCAEVREKIRETCMKKYGGASYLTGNEYISKFLKKQYNVIVSILEKYDTECLFSSDEYRGYDEVVDEKRKRINYNFRCKKCGKEFESHFISGNIPKCPDCYDIGGGTSNLELEVLEFVKSLSQTVKNGDRTILDGLELDILDEVNKIAIEVNGLYWHCEEMGKDKYYHLDKTKKCLNKDIQLIHIFEDEWNEKKRIVKWRLKHLFGAVKSKIYARKCNVKEINNSSAQRFLQKYHLQGQCKSSLNLGLFYKNRLVSVMTFSKSRFNKNYDWELLRFASIFSFNVIGGAGKLLKYFENNYNGSLISYADKRWSKGNLYRQLGFDEIKDSSPSYFYTKGLKRFNRVMFQKHKLKKLLENYDENLSEYENMSNNGFMRIWDCGNKVFVKNKR